MLAGHLALVSAALFTGAACYINFAEHPARAHLEIGPFLTQWKPSYSRGFVMRSTLAIIGFLFGAAAWWTTRRFPFLFGGLLIVATWPWTLLGILPTNRVLFGMDPASAGVEARTLLTRWNRPHSVRTALGAPATVAFGVALTRFQTDPPTASLAQPISAMTTNCVSPATS